MTEPRATKHLEMLQDAIARMAGYSFLAKGWSVTVATAILGLAVKDGGPQFLWVGGLAVVLFWLIDAYCLGLERGFRALFDAAVQSPIETFDMTPKTDGGATLVAASRPSVLMVHPPLLVAFLLADYFLRKA